MSKSSGACPFTLCHHTTSQVFTGAVSTRNRSLNTCLVMEKHTSWTVLCWLGILIFPHPIAPSWLEMSHCIVEQICSVFQEKPNLEKCHKPWSMCEDSWVLCIEVLVWDRNAISRLVATCDPHHSWEFFPFNSVIVTSTVNVYDISYPELLMLDKFSLKLFVSWWWVVLFVYWTFGAHVSWKSWIL